MPAPSDVHVSLSPETTNPLAFQTLKSMISTAVATKEPVKVRRAGSLEIPILTYVAAAALFYGWLQRSEGHITAETGIGYYLGITGSVLMLMLLLYPLRKRMSSLRFIGGVRSWFRIHMILGVIGPTLILLHSNFILGSLNSTVALMTMSTVALSGFVGRFLYARIHRGLYGHKHSANELANDVAEAKCTLNLGESFRAEMADQLSIYEETRLAGHHGFWRSFCFIFTGPFVRRGLKNRLIKRATVSLKDRGLSNLARRNQLLGFKANLDQYFTAFGRAEAFSFYERLFALWHLLHLPLFAILVLAALAHVLAVHLF
ncbi:MAG: hypothetical protein V7761_04615 [Amylibacter sp.]